MSETLLGCPHCGKPVGFTAAMAGQVVACPHCRGQFQMPDRPPSSPPPPPRGNRKRADEGSLSFDEEAGPGGRDSSVKAELGFYRAAVTLATVLAIGGSVVFLIGAILTVVTVLVPLWRSGSDVGIGVGLVWVLLVFIFAFIGIACLFLVRSCVLVGVDAARTLRRIERDAAAAPKSK